MFQVIWDRGGGIPDSLPYYIYKGGLLHVLVQIWKPATNMRFGGCAQIIIQGMSSQFLKILYRGGVQILQYLINGRPPRGFAPSFQKFKHQEICSDAQQICCSIDPTGKGFSSIVEIIQMSLATSPAERVLEKK